MDAVKLLGSLLGNNATGGNVLGSLLGGGGGGGGGLGSIVGSLLGGGGQQRQQQSAGGGLGGLLGGLLGGGAQQQAPQAQETDQAVILIRAMVNAAKADGQIDKQEIQNIVGRLGEIDQREAAFLKQELEAPLDIRGFCDSVPSDFSQQAYAFSLMGMRLDTKQEAQYLGALAQGLNLNPQICNAIHDKVGAPKIFQ